jgi:hypothetical protein
MGQPSRKPIYIYITIPMRAARLHHSHNSYLITRGVNYGLLTYETTVVYYMYPKCCVDEVMNASLTKISKTQHKSVETKLALRATTGETQDDETGRAKAAGSSEAAELLDVVISSGLKATGFET